MKRNLMKRNLIKRNLIIFALLFGVTACNKPKEEVKKPNITVEVDEGAGIEANIVGDSNEAPQTNLEIKNEVPHADIKPQGEIKYDKQSDVFNLTAEEIKLYEDFSKNFDKAIFAGVDPKSIFKIWITAGVSEAWETEYKLYNEQSVKDANLTEQVFFDNHMQDLNTEKNTTRKQVAEHNFQFFNDATWKEGEDGFGYLEFKAPDATLENGEKEEQPPFKVKFMKNPAGYFELVYYPIS